MWKKILNHGLGNWIVSENVYGILSNVRMKVVVIMQPLICAWVKSFRRWKIISNQLTLKYANSTSEVRIALLPQKECTPSRTKEGTCRIRKHRGLLQKHSPQNPLLQLLLLVFPLL